MRLWALHVASMPLALAAAFSKALWRNGTFQLVNGKMVVATSRHPVALVTNVGLSEAAFIIILATMGCAHPGQSLWPLVRVSSICAASFSVSLLMLITSHSYVGG